MKVLRARIFEAERQRQVRALSNQRQGLIGSGDRSERIRTYNFPQVLIPLHRQGHAEVERTPCERACVVYARGAIHGSCFGMTFTLNIQRHWSLECSVMSTQDCKNEPVH